VPKLIDNRDFLGGMLIALLGAGAVLEGRRHSIGTFMEMGAGFFPIVLGVALLVVGLLIVLGGLATASVAQDEMGHEIQAPDWRGCTAIVLGVLAFIVLGGRYGLMPATFSCSLIAALGDRSMTWRSAFALAAALTALATGLFWYLLQIPFPLVRW
jgi:hypothetical protein